MAHGAAAQSYPSRPVSLVVPYAAGGPTDVLARIIVEPMRSVLGQPVIVEHLGGAAGNIAARKVVREKPDGYTAIIGNWGTHVVNGAVQTLPYDLRQDFEPVGLIATNPHVIVSRNTVPARDLKELIAWVKENQDRLTAANSGPVARQRSLFPEQDRNEVSLRAVPRIRSGPAGPSLRPLPNARRLGRTRHPSCGRPMMPTRAPR